VKDDPVQGIIAAIDDLAQDEPVEYPQEGAKHAQSRPPFFVHYERAANVNGARAHSGESAQLYTPLPVWDGILTRAFWRYTGTIALALAVIRLFSAVWTADGRHDWWVSTGLWAVGGVLMAFVSWPLGNIRANRRVRSRQLESSRQFAVFIAYVESLSPEALEEVFGLVFRPVTSVEAERESGVVEET